MVKLGSKFATKNVFMFPKGSSCAANEILYTQDDINTTFFYLQEKTKNIKTTQRKSSGSILNFLAK